MSEPADESVLFAHGVFDRFDGIGGGSEATGIFEREHGKIVEMIADGKHGLGLNGEAAGNFRQGGAFVISRMAEASIDIIAHNGEVGDRAAKIGQKAMDDIRVAIGPGDETKGRVRVFVNPGMEAGVDPINNPREFRLEARQRSTSPTPEESGVADWFGFAVSIRAPLTWSGPQSGCIAVR